MMFPVLRAGGTLPTDTADDLAHAIATGASLPRVPTGMTSQQPALSASMNSMAPMSAGGGITMTASSAASATMSGATMTAAAPAATVLPSMTLQPNVVPAPRQIAQRKARHRKCRRQDPERQGPTTSPLRNAPRRKRSWRSAAALMPSGVTPLSPSALSAAVAPPRPRAPTCAWCRIRRPLAASLPSAAAAAARHRRRADGAAAERADDSRPCRRSPCSPWRRRRPSRPSRRSPCRRRATKNSNSACSRWTTAR